MIGLRMSSKDNVAVVVENVKKGDIVSVDGTDHIAIETIPVGHKIAIQPIQKGEMIIKYGKIIGEASEDIDVGAWVHCHNVLDITEQLCSEYAKNYRARKDG